MVRGTTVTVVGGGLAGCEAAWQLASAGFSVVLYEMRPARSTPAHRTHQLAELVCSNSLRSDNPENAVGLLKREMEALGSLILAAARATRLPAGDALAVDRHLFAQTITQAVEDHPGIRVVREEVQSLPEPPAIVATGPLTSPALEQALVELLGEDALSFFDAIAPVVAADSLDHSKLFRASRYGKGNAQDYLNAPLSRKEYEAFVAALLAAEKVPLKPFEEGIPYFEGCLPVEVMAERGVDTLRFGPMKPVGLVDPRTGTRPYAVVQLRQDDLAADHYNLVGFQTRLTIPAQKEVFRLIPGLEQARFVRFGMVHRNTFLCAPKLLTPQLGLRAAPGVRLAGQITGVEGYVESAATGLLAALFTLAELLGVALPPPPPWTAHGGLVRHLTQRDARGFQPANAAWGLMTDPPVLLPRDKGQRRRQAAALALEAIGQWRQLLPLPVPDPKKLVSGAPCPG
ncbi:MAG: methylenetetrahydrofolate--tRNA-(uracil(54)-C(5))-methyltransferase (FADH(2)-oxidizing) TrmFO [Thermoanaerobaculum sp.]|nr:methylenetetrahydrofolate--tRNA-(uracil(54)-C(5))-methyltransferase (FADH(2)-oxidizing) TrmFO [Thermoanaerobaculum sp.]